MMLSKRIEMYFSVSKWPSCVPKIWVSISSGDLYTWDVNLSHKKRKEIIANNKELNILIFIDCPDFTCWYREGVVVVYLVIQRDLSFTKWSGIFMEQNLQLCKFSRVNSQRHWTVKWECLLWKGKLLWERFLEKKKNKN